MTVTLQLNPVTSSAVFTGFTADLIGATPIASYNNLVDRVDSLEFNLTQDETLINSLSTTVNGLSTTVSNLNPSSVGLSSIAQNSSNDILLNANTFVDGQLTAYAKLETRISTNGLNLQAWSETTKHSSRLDLWSEDNTKEFELSVFRDTYCSNVKSAFVIYKPNQTDTINHYLAASGESCLCANNGYLGVGFLGNPSERLHVNGNIRATGSLKLGTNINQVNYASAAPTTGTYKRGDIVLNNAPSASGFIGWVCVTAGTPGTWKTWGVISA